MPQPVKASDERAARIKANLKRREEAEAAIAADLRDELDAVGEVAWLAWCTREFGWSRTAAYTHLRPGGLEADRERKSHTEQSTSGIPDIVERKPEVTPLRIVTRE